MSSTSTTLCDVLNMFPNSHRRNAQVHIPRFPFRSWRSRARELNSHVRTRARSFTPHDATGARRRGDGRRRRKSGRRGACCSRATLLLLHARTRGSIDQKARVRLRSWRSCCGRSCCRASSRCASCLRKRDDVGSRGITREHASRGRGMGCYGHEAARRVLEHRCLHSMVALSGRDMTERIVSRICMQTRRESADLFQTERMSSW